MLFAWKVFDDINYYLFIMFFYRQSVFFLGYQMVQFNADANLFKHFTVVYFSRIY